MLLALLFAGLNVFADSDGLFVKSDLFGNLGIREKGAVLVVHFGTSFDDTRRLRE